MYDEERILDEYGIPSSNFLLYRILDGDKSDGIPGIRGAWTKNIVENVSIAGSPHKHSIEDLLKS